MKRLLFSALAGRKEHHHVAISRLDPGVRTVLHNHDFPEFFLTLDGELVHEWNNKRIRMQTGELGLVLPADRHCFKCERRQPARIVNLAISPQWWQIFESLGGPGEIIAPCAQRHQRLVGRQAAACVQELHRILNAVQEDTALLTSTVVLLVSMLRPIAGPSLWASPSEPGLAPEWLVKLLGEIEHSQRLDQPLSYWQRQSGRSPEHLARCCRKFLGHTLTDLVNRARLNRIKTELLQGNGAKIADLALAAGFNNLGHFYRLFGRAEGCSPKKWSRSHSWAPTVPR